MSLFTLGTSLSFVRIVGKAIVGLEDSRSMLELMLDYLILSE